mmetsp:Transcript_7111/g.17045  ORF Transcript_7111/g.17045 Transcript_7111/m.17045 type:complete len:84 (-) Transcript_7111:48-299(-)
MAFRADLCALPATSNNAAVQSTLALAQVWGASGLWLGREWMLAPRREPRDEDGATNCKGLEAAKSAATPTRATSHWGFAMSPG